MEIKTADILILGAGWTSTFLLPLLEKESISHAATSTTGRDGTIKFVFNPTSSDTRPYEALPFARTILITFPLKGPGQSAHLHALYTQTHTHPSTVPSPNFMQLGSTGIWQIPDQELWLTRHSPYDAINDRAVAEDELRSLGGCVLNLSGLWGGVRQPRDFVKRVIPDKDALRKKGSLHMVHGEDVARAIVALHGDFTSGERWMILERLDLSHRFRAMFDVPANHASDLLICGSWILAAYVD